MDSTSLDKRQIRNTIDQKLIKTGEKDRLKEFIRQKLVECGWRDQMKSICKEYIQSKGLEQVSVDQLITDITPQGRALVPDNVKNDLLVKIRKFLSESCD